MKNIRSSLFKLNLRDLVNGLITAFFTSLLTGIYNLLTTGTIINWISIKVILLTAIAAMIGYLIKNLFTNSEGKVFKMEPKNK